MRKSPKGWIWRRWPPCTSTLWRWRRSTTSSAGSTRAGRWRSRRNITRSSASIGKCRRAWRCRCWAASPPGSRWRRSPGEDTLNFADFAGDPDTYALQVRGESMIEDHICDGDYVLVEKASEARNGEIVVALVDGVGDHAQALLQRAGRPGAAAARECVDAADLCAESGGKHPRQAAGGAAEVLISDPDAGAPQAVGDGLTEIEPTLPPGIARLGRPGRAEDVHPLRFQHLLDAVDVITVAHHNARFQIHPAHDFRRGYRAFKRGRSGGFSENGFRRDAVAAQIGAAHFGLGERRVAAGPAGGQDARRPLLAVEKERVIEAGFENWRWLPANTPPRPEP